MVLSSYTLDTDIVIEVLRGNQRVVARMDQLGPGTQISITGLTIYELYKGVAVMQDEDRREEVEQFISSAETLDLDLKAEKKAGEIYANLRSNGELISDADILIAAIVIANDSILVTNNTKHFSRIEGLEFENWLEEKHG
ncbi:MAG TPA: type II toxin-antitoxin system VapC family toxin [Candidatus Fraserbacteria bacterium]|nr:type II toxin-antitoxin system VapC family toxin [Candidatus Fraserbacteria bacterium]